MRGLKPAAQRARALALANAALDVPESAAPASVPVPVPAPVPVPSSPKVSAQLPQVTALLASPQAPVNAKSPQELPPPKPRVAIQPSAGANPRLFAQALRNATGSVLKRTPPTSDASSGTSLAAPKPELVNEAGSSTSKLCPQAAVFSPGTSPKLDVPDWPSSPKPISDLSPLSPSSPSGSLAIDAQASDLSKSPIAGVVLNTGAPPFSPSRACLLRAPPTTVPSLVSGPSEPRNASSSPSVRSALLLPANGSSGSGLYTDALASSSHSHASPSVVKRRPFALEIKPPPIVSRRPACSSSRSPSDKPPQLNAPISESVPRGAVSKPSSQPSTMLRPDAVVFSPKPPYLAGSQRESESKAPLLLPQITAVASPTQQVDVERPREIIPESAESKTPSSLLLPVISAPSSSTALPVSSTPSPPPLAELRARATSFSPKCLFMNVADKASSGI